MAAESKSNTKTKTKSGHRAKDQAHKPKKTSWQDDLGIGYATYDHEEDYVSPTTIGKAQVDNLRSFKQRLAIAPVFVDDES